MKRRQNTDAGGEAFTGEVKSFVWWKARRITGYDAKVWAVDACGAIIKWSDYGNTSSVYGWEIDHILAVANGGGDNLDNLQPLQWQNNRKKGDERTQLYCVMRGGA